MQCHQEEADRLAELARLQEQIGDLAGAVDSISRLERLGQERDGAPEPEIAEHLDALLERAEVRIERGDLEGAKEDAQQAFEREPRNLRA